MTSNYFNSRAAIWDEEIAEKDQDKLRRLAQNLDIRICSRVMDVGTGTGVLIPFLMQRIGEKGELFCLDFASEMLKMAGKKRFKGLISYVCGDIMHCCFKGDVFDAAVCYSSFPHFKDKTRALREIHRVLKRGGLLYVCHSSSREAINQTHRNLPEVNNDLIPDEAELRNLLQETGFELHRYEDDPEMYLVSARKSGPV